VDVVLGDARLSLERDSPQQFDVLLVDAFSGDSIPVHLLTRESFELYYRHLRPGGILAVHVSNRYLDLKPVVQELADATGRQTALIDTDDDDYEVFGATWVLVTENRDFLNSPAVKAARKKIDRRPYLAEWTDDYNNLFQIIRWQQ
jgi:spermidine synthase